MDAKATVLGYRFGESVTGILIPYEFLNTIKDLEASFLFSHFCFISVSCADNEGWFFYMESQAKETLCMGKTAYRNARTKLEELGVIETVTGIDKKNRYKIDFSAMANLLAGEGHVSSPRHVSSPGKVTKRDSRKVTKRDVEEQYTNNSNEEQFNSISSISHGTASASPTQSACDDDIFKEHLFPGTKTLEEFAAWVVKTYPRKPDGIGATSKQVGTFMARLVKACRTGRVDKIEDAKYSFDAFREGVKKLRHAVDTGKRDPMYIPAFHNFAGLGVMFGKPPGYLEWSQAIEPPKKKRELVV